VGYIEKGNNWTKYGQWYGMQDDWCCIFVSWCAFQANVSTDIIPKLAYVPYMYDFFLKRKRWKVKGIYRPKAGDLIIFGDNDHIGIVEKADNNYVYSIEGNTSNNGDVSRGEGVYRRTRPLNYWWIKGYCIPDYEEDKMTGEEIYNELQNYLAKQPLPSWAKAELEEAKALGITDGKNPMQLIPRYQAAIMANRAVKK
jgi:hypothetical protein